MDKEASGSASRTRTGSGIRGFFDSLLSCISSLLHARPIDAHKPKPHGQEDSAPLMEALRDPDVKRMESAAIALERLGVPEAGPLLVLRHLALRRYGKIAEMGPGAAPGLIGALDHPSMRIREDAITMLSRSGARRGLSMSDLAKTLRKQAGEGDGAWAARSFRRVSEGVRSCKSGVCPGIVGRAKERRTPI